MAAPPKIAHRSLPTTDPERKLGNNAPSRVGPYVVERKLASGGMGTVYLARDPEGARIALKCIHPQMAEREDLVAMFVDEARIASRITHPNVCRVLDYGTADGRPFIAMEYLEGATVSALLRAVSRSGQSRGSHIPGYGARIVSDACRGLHAAHELRDERGNLLDVVHRDVTIRNVLVGYDGRVSVLDFGIARAADQIHETRTGVVKGTLLYMSPEQIRRKGVDRRSDVWSIGVVLWEVLTGRSLFRRRTDLDALVAIERGPIPKPSLVAPQVPVELDDISLRALSRDPDGRWETAAQLADALDSVLASLGDAPDERALGAWARGLVPPPRVSSAAVPVPRSGEIRTQDEGSDSGALSGESEPGSDPAAVLPAWDVEPEGPRRGRGSRDARDDSSVAQASTRLLGDHDDAPARPSAPRVTAATEHVDHDHVPIAVPAAPTRVEESSPKRGSSSIPWIAAIAALAAIVIGLGVWIGTRDTTDTPRSTTLADLREQNVATVGETAPSTSGSLSPTGERVGVRVEPTPSPRPSPAPSPPPSPTPSVSPSLPPSPSPSLPPSPSPTPIDRVGLGTLRVVFVGGWATVSVDGRNLGSSPVQLRLPAGRHSVSLLPMGRPPAVRRSVTVRAGGSQTVRVVRETEPN